MKKVVRRSIFETNSSSTHAVAFVNEKIGATKEDLYRLGEKPRKISTAYGKMVFYWGFECAEYTYEKKEVRTKKLEPHMQILLDECEKIATFDRVKTEELMRSCINEPYYRHNCSGFFEEGDLTGDCQCGMDERKILSTLGYTRILDDDTYREFVCKLFSPEMVFLTTEYWNGCYEIDGVDC